MNDTTYNNEISNRMLYDLMDRRFNELEVRMSRLEVKVDRLELKVEKNSQRIEELFLRGDKVQIGFSRLLLAGNSILTMVIAFIVAMFTGQYVMKVK